MNISRLIIESEHLKQVPISLKYKEVIFKELTEEITKYLFPQPAKEISETEDFIDTSLVGIKN